MLILSHDSALRFWRNTALWGWGYTPDRMQLTKVPATSVQTRCGQKAARMIATDYNLPLPLHILGDRKQRNACKNKLIHGIPSVMDEVPALILKDGLAVVSPALCLMQVLNGRDDHAALKLVCEFCGCYALIPHDGSSMTTRPTPILTLQDCIAHAKRYAGCWGAGKLRRASERAIEGAASPMETNDSLFMTLPYALGGKNISGFALNQRIELDERARELAGSDYLVCDFFWPKQGIAVEYDSDQHHLDSAQHARDARRRSALMAMGIRVITLTREQNMRMEDFDAFLSFLMRELGHEFRPRAKDYDLRKAELFKGLFFTSGL